MSIESIERQLEANTPDIAALLAVAKAVTSVLAHSSRCPCCDAVRPFEHPPGCYLSQALDALEALP